MTTALRRSSSSSLDIVGHRSRKGRAEVSCVGVAALLEERWDQQRAQHAVAAEMRWTEGSSCCCDRIPSAAARCGCGLVCLSVCLPASASASAAQPPPPLLLSGSRPKLSAAGSLRVSGVGGHCRRLNSLTHAPTAAHSVNAFKLPPGPPLPMKLTGSQTALNLICRTTTAQQQPPLTASHGAVTAVTRHASTSDTRRETALSGVEALCVTQVRAAMSAASPVSFNEPPAVYLHPATIPHALLLFLLTVAFSFLYHRYSAPALRYLTTSASSRSALNSISSRLSSLRAQSAQLNSPSTFAQYAKLERQIAVLSKQRE